MNAASNLAFLIAAAAAYRVALNRDRLDAPELGVITLGGLIGIGSFLFHTLANSWSEIADVIPIWSFVVCFVVLVIYRFTRENLFRTARIAAIGALITVGTVWFTAGDVITDSGAPSDRFNGSLQYAPALIALIIFAGLTQLRNHPARLYVTGAAVTFFVSLIFRSIDLANCGENEIGTHFVWHLLNGLMVGLLLQALVRHFPPQGAKTKSHPTNSPL